MYLAAGVWGRRPLAFAGWSLLAVVLWTPALLLAALVFGDAVTGVFLGDVERLCHFLTAGVVLLVVLRAAAQVVTRTLTQQLR
jgi:membrane protein DedA with SNARE-associated domain